MKSKALDKAMRDVLKIKATEEVIEKCEEYLDKLDDINIFFDQKKLMEIFKFILETHKGLFEALQKMKLKKRKKENNKGLYI